MSNRELLEPVAVVTDNYSRDGVNDEISAYLPVGTELYTSPPAQLEQKLDGQAIKKGAPPSVSASMRPNVVLVVVLVPV